jgi:hypothetical protein
LSLQVIETASDIQKTRDFWNSWPGTRDSDPDFFLFIAGIRPEVIGPRVILARRDGAPDAMLVGRLERRRIPIKFGYLHFSSPRMRVLNLIDGGLRGNASAENVDLLVGHVLKSLRNGDLDMAYFERLQVGSPLHHGVRTLSRAFERGISRGRTIHRWLRLPDSSEGLYKILSPEHRQNYRRKGRKLLKDFPGEVQIRRYESPDDLQLVFRDVEAIAQKTYQRGLGFGFQDSAETRGRFELAASKGWLRAFVLYVAGNPVAYWNAMAYCGTLWGDQIGYDPEFRRYSPGMYLSLTVLGEMCDHPQDHGISRADYGIGDAEYKSLLSNNSYEEEDVLIYGRTLRGIGINAISAPVQLADLAAKRILARSNLLVRAKRFLRDRARSGAGHSGSEQQQPSAES